MYTKHTLQTIIPLTLETLQKLQTFVDMIIKWQKAVNLVSKHSIPHIWHRHIADSVQLYPHIPNRCRNIADLGSGGGLPAIVLAILAQDSHIGQNMHITMIESHKKKAIFLQQCIRELNLNASVINDRIENIQHADFDMVSSRALCDMISLCYFMKHLNCPQGIFLKSKSVDQEIENAESKYIFTVEKTDSCTQNKSAIVSICFM